MITLNDGLVVSLTGNGGDLIHVGTRERWPVQEEDVPLLRLLARGTDTRPAGLEGLEAQGWVTEREDPCDPQILDRLQTLDARFAWANAASDAHVREALERAHASRRVLHRGYGQYAALPETVARRAKLLEGKHHVALLGDDDLLGVGLAAAGVPAVTVFDIDDEVTTAIERHCATDAVTIEQRDLRRPYDGPLGFADAFFADPLSSEIPFQLMLSRGLAMLKPDGIGFVCVAEPGQASFDRVRRRIGFDVVGHYVDFNHYYTPWFTLAAYLSDLFIVKPHPAMILDPAPDEMLLSPGMSDEERYLSQPASRYLWQDVELRRLELFHLKTALDVAKHAGQLEVLAEEMVHEPGFRSYVAIAKGGQAIYVRVEPAERRVELFVAPADAVIENALVACIGGLTGAHYGVLERKRTRNSTLTRFYRKDF